MDFGAMLDLHVGSVRKALGFGFTTDRCPEPLMVECGRFVVNEDRQDLELLPEEV